MGENSETEKSILRLGFFITFIRWDGGRLIFCLNPLCAERSESARAGLDLSSSITFNLGCRKVTVDKSQLWKQWGNIES